MSEPCAICGGPSQIEHAYGCCDRCQTAHDPEVGCIAPALALTAFPVVAHKPGWRFTWSEHNGSSFIEISFESPSEKALCARTGLPRPPVSIMLMAPQPFDPMWLLRHVVELEKHETLEWFRVDGALVLDPHSPGEP